MAVIVALTIMLLGLALVWAGRGIRRRRGLTDARTLDLDGRNLFSARLRLAGRPDRVIEEDGLPIPEEWKSSPRLYDGHIAQLGVYFILIEEETGIRPPHGYIGVKDGQPPHRIENTDELRAWVLRLADEIRASRREPEKPIPVRQPPGKCRRCGVREWCGQRSG